MTEPELPFWKRKTLAEMTPEEWESLCDGCGRCCLFKLQDEEDGQVYYTSVACRLLDQRTCRCTQYARRSELVPTCVVLTPENVGKLGWMPHTCAYRLIAEGKDLPRWHPLVSRRPGAIHHAGISVRGKVVSEEEAGLDNLEDYIIE